MVLVFVMSGSQLQDEATSGKGFIMFRTPIIKSHMGPKRIQKKESKVRLRGRPRKEATDEPLGEKRARGREAQKNYMARKQAETDRLRKRIASLDKTVESIVTEFIHFGDRRVNSSQPLSGIPQLDDLKQTTRRILGHAHTAESLANEGGGESISDTLPFTEVSTTSTASQLPSSPPPPNRSLHPLLGIKKFPSYWFPSVSNPNWSLQPSTWLWTSKQDRPSWCGRGILEPLLRRRAQLIRLASLQGPNHPQHPNFARRNIDSRVHSKSHAISISIRET